MKIFVRKCHTKTEQSVEIFLQILNHSQTMGIVDMLFIQSCEVIS